ncbi:hypothetical protein ACS0TY_010366 [Phlomoides rotata]
MEDQNHEVVDGVNVEEIHNNQVGNRIGGANPNMVQPQHNQQVQNVGNPQQGGNQFQGNQGGGAPPHGYYIPQPMYYLYPPPYYPYGGNPQDHPQAPPPQQQPPPQQPFVPEIPRGQYQGRPIREAFEPQMRELYDNMARPNIQANNFEISDC